VATSEVYTSINLYIAPYGDSGLDAGGDISVVFSQLANAIEQFFLDKTPPNVSLTLFPPTFVPVNIEVIVTALPQYKQSTVKKNVEKALADILAFDNVFFAERISLHYVVEALASATGVAYSTVTKLVRDDDVDQDQVIDAVCETNELPAAGTIDVTVTGGIAD
jgi:hypothetical protein